MNGVDAIIFTAGVGENSPEIRRQVCTDMEFFGIHLDQEKNKNITGLLSEINTLDSRVKILVIATNEEVEIAKQCYDLLNSKN